MKLLVNKRERAAGAFVLTTLALVIFFVVGAAIRNRWFHPRVNFHGVMVRGEGMREGAPIFLSGVEVGEIGSLTIRDDDRVAVLFLIWKEHAHRIRSNTHAVARRLYGIGEKRIHLESEPGGEQLLENSPLPIDERIDLLDAVANLDLRLPMQVLDRTISTADRLLSKFDEDDRLDRMIDAFDRLGPTLESAESLLNDPNMKSTLAGVSTIVNAPSTRKTLDRAALLLAPERIDRVLAQSEGLLGRIDELAKKGGPLEGTLKGANRVLTDGRLDKLLNSASDSDKLARILDNTALLTEQLGKVAPGIPSMTRELTMTLREAVVTLKALQETWILEGKAKRARKEIEREQRE
jgi:phospholipid/cholesterol/gamma-HCH transport system substrate-binding protein